MSLASTSSVGPSVITRAEVEDVGPRREAGHQLDVVFDQQDREALDGLHLAERLRQRRRLDPIESGRRLVEQEQLGLGHQCPTDLDESALAEAEPFDRLVRELAQPEQVEHLVAAARAPRPSRARGPGRPSRTDRCRRRTRSAMKRWSRTVESANSSIRWKVRPIPARARRCTGRPVRSWPSSATVPASIDVTPSMQLKKVVFPAPLGPISPTRSPVVDVDADVVEREDPGEPLRDVGDLEQGAHATVSPARASSAGGSAGGVGRRPANAFCWRRCGLGRSSVHAVLDEALGVSGVEDRAEAEEDQHPLPRDREEPGIRPGSRRIQPRNAPLRTTGSNSTKANAAWIAPEMVRTPRVTTTTTHTRLTNGEKLLP